MLLVTESRDYGEKVAISFALTDADGTPKNRWVLFGQRTPHRLGSYPEVTAEDVVRGLRAIADGIEAAGEARSP